MGAFSQQFTFPAAAVTHHKSHPGPGTLALPFKQALLRPPPPLSTYKGIRILIPKYLVFERARQSEAEKKDKSPPAGSA